MDLQEANKELQLLRGVVLWRLSEARRRFLARRRVLIVANKPLVAAVGLIKVVSAIVGIASNDQRAAAIVSVR